MGGLEDGYGGHDMVNSMRRCEKLYRGFTRYRILLSACDKSEMVSTKVVYLMLRQLYLLSGLSP